MKTGFKDLFWKKRHIDESSLDELQQEIHRTTLAAGRAELFNKLGIGLMQIGVAILALGAGWYGAMLSIYIEAGAPDLVAEVRGTFSTFLFFSLVAILLGALSICLIGRRASHAGAEATRLELLYDRRLACN